MKRILAALLLLSSFAASQLPTPYPYGMHTAVTSAQIIAALGYTPAKTSDTAGFTRNARNLSDLASASTARTNLGLATIAATGDASNLTGTTLAATVVNTSITSTGIINGVFKVIGNATGQLNEGIKMVDASDGYSALSAGCPLTTSGVCNWAWLKKPDHTLELWDSAAAPVFKITQAGMYEFTGVGTTDGNFTIGGQATMLQLNITNDAGTGTGVGIFGTAAPFAGTGIAPVWVPIYYKGSRYAVPFYGPY